jgi:alpha-tubulin suppressor-like RCC1 family protein
MARSRSQTLRLGLTLCAIVFTTAGGVGACAGIVGVEDVKLRRDSSIADVSEEEEEGIDTGPKETGPQPLENILEVSLGQQHTCGRKPDGTVKCWGNDESGQIGIGGDGGLFPTPQPVGITDAIRISSGKNHTCIVHKTGTVSCWGQNQDGQLGNGQKNVNSSKPVDVMNVANARGIACGATFSCALITGGGVMCWGNGLGGQLGTGSKVIQPTAVQVADLTDAVGISAGESHACAVKSDGKLACWGDGINGQLGNGDQLEKTKPTLAALTDVALVTAAQRSTCAMKKDGSVYCWGANELGQLGSGAASSSPNPSPIVVSGLTQAIAASAGAIHACAVKTGGAVVCWGNGFQGQLGDGVPRPDASTPQPSPAPVSGITNAIGVATGGNHSCAPTSSGLILCWGENAHGELGKGVVGAPLLSPEAVQTYP